MLSGDKLCCSQPLLVVDNKVSLAGQRGLGSVACQVVF